MILLLHLSILSNNKTAVETNVCLKKVTHITKLPFKSRFLENHDNVSKHCWLVRYRNAINSMLQWMMCNISLAWRVVNTSITTNTVMSKFLVINKEFKLADVHAFVLNVVNVCNFLPFSKWLGWRTMKWNGYVVILVTLEKFMNNTTGQHQDWLSD